MKYCIKRLPLSLSFAMLAALILGSCKESTIINSNVSPSGNNLGVFDTSLAVQTRTYYNDSIITSQNYDGTGLGIYQAVVNFSDAFFGQMIASTSFQVTPTNFTDAIYTGGTIDSVALVLPYSGYTYGDTLDQTQTQTYQVYYLQDTLSTGAFYYSNTNKAVDEANPLSPAVTVNVRSLKDSITVKGVRYAPGLRITLNKDAVLSKLLPALTGLATSSSPAATFNSRFNGVAVRTTAGSATAASIPYFRLNGAGPYTQAGIIVYYRNSSNVDTFQHYYFSTSASAHYNKISKIFASAPVNALYTSTAVSDSVIAIQNQPGANLDIKVPGIKSLPKGIISKAELQLTVLPHRKSSLFAPPPRLYVRARGNGTYPAGIAFNERYEVADRYPLGSTAPFLILDGTGHTYTKNGTTLTTYTIGIPREVMNSINASNDVLHLQITGTEDFYGAYQLLLGGGNYPDTTYRARLFVVYSAIQK